MGRESGGRGERIPNTRGSGVAPSCLLFEPLSPTLARKFEGCEGDLFALEVEEVASGGALTVVFGAGSIPRLLVGTRHGGEGLAGEVICPIWDGTGVTPGPGGGGLPKCSAGFINELGEKRGEFLEEWLTLLFEEPLEPARLWPWRGILAPPPPEEKPSTTRLKENSWFTTLGVLGCGGAFGREVGSKPPIGDNKLLPIPAKARGA